MSLKTKQNKSSHYGGRHARKKTRKNIVVGPKNYIDKNEDMIYAQRQQVTVYMMMQQPQQRRRSSKKPPPKPRRLYLEKEWSYSPSPPESPVVRDFELIPSSKQPPPRPPLPKKKTLPSPGPKDARKMMVPLKAKQNMTTENSPSQEKRLPPLPKPRHMKQRDSSSDVNVDELKCKLQALQPMDTCSTGSAMLKLTPPKSATKKSPPPSAQRAAQAKLQPLLPPTARPRKTKTESSNLSENRSTLSIDMAREWNKLPQAGGVRNEMAKSCADFQSRKTKPLPLVPPLPAPRSRIKSNKDEEDSSNITSVQKSPVRSRPIPIPKSRNASGSRDQGVAPARVEEEESSKSPIRPVPRARVVSKENKEQSLGNRDNDMRQGDKQSITLDRDLSVESSKPPVPRKRAYKESLTDVPIKELHPVASGRDVPMFSASLATNRGSLRYSGDRSTRSKRKKGGRIRAPLWRAPPPPDFTPPPPDLTTPPPIPGSTPRRSPKRPPPIAQISATPTSATPNFILPPFQHSPMVPPTEEVAPSVFVMPTPPSTSNSPHEKPIELAKTPVSSPRISSKIQFEDNLFENKSIKRKRIPSGQNILPLSIVQELQNNFRMQARR